jgi:L-alanine-DL-glutamate epimerase-like enolase superfamily enzyme
MMKPMAVGPLELQVDLEKWPLKAPLRITGYSWDSSEVLLVRLEASGKIGLGEGAGVFYKNDSPAKMRLQLEGLRGTIEKGLTRDMIQTLLPPGGARNALDCALWDLEAKLTGQPAWQMAGLEGLRPLLTTFTCGANSPEEMARVARSYRSARAIKLKLTGEPTDADRVLAVREARPEVWLGIDANQGFSRGSLEKLLPVLVDARVQLIEQPFPLSEDALLDGFESPIAIAADESVQGAADVARLVGRFQVVNIKLDKCGGLTEGLAMARIARSLGLDTMVGNMTGTSLGMAPGLLVGQLCAIVDLDGPVFLKSDRANPVNYTDGYISCPETLWGGTQSARAI